MSPKTNASHLSQHSKTKRPAPENDLQSLSQASTSSEVHLIHVNSAPIENRNKSHHNSPDNSAESRLRPPNITRTSQSGSHSRRKPKRQVHPGSVTPPARRSLSPNPNPIHRSNVPPSWASSSTTSSLADLESSLPLLFLEPVSSSAGASVDRKKSFVSGAGAVLQVASATLKLTPIPYLGQIPDLLLILLQVYESADKNCKDLKGLNDEVQKAYTTILRPLLLWTGSIPPPLTDLIKDFYLALVEQIKQIKSLQSRGRLERVFLSKEITQSINEVKACLNKAVTSFSTEATVLTLVQVIKSFLKSELSKLGQVPAEYKFVTNKSECLPDTRARMQDSLLNHLRNAQNRFVWLRGSPGTGKTAICKSISSTLDQRGALAASFFWDKNRKGTGLDSIEMFPSSLAYQLAHFNADYEILLVKQLQNPALRMVQSLPLKEQMRALIIEPMSNIKDMFSSRREHFAIVLDGLDECGNQEALESLMGLVIMLEGLPSAFAVLVSSRPETQVIRAQAQGGVWGDVIPCDNMDMINKSETFYTIRRMVDDGLKIRISKSLWKPLEEDLDTFASACRELPVIASMRIREVCARTQRGVTLKSEFDYFRNLLDAPTDLNSEYLRIRLVVGTLAVARELLSVNSIAQLLGITEDEVYATLGPISSIVDLPSTGEGQPKFYHATAKEFIVGHPTCDHPFFIDKDGYFLGLLLLRFLRGLAMPTDRFLGDKKKWMGFRWKNQPEHTQYAVKYLFSHLDSSKLFFQDSNELQQEFDHFLTHNLLWFIVLSQGEFTLPDNFRQSNNNNYGSTQLLREAERANEYVVDQYRHPTPLMAVHPSCLSKSEAVRLFYPWHIFRSMLPFTPTSSPLFESYSHLSDHVRIFSISGEFTGHLIPLSQHALNASMIMEAKLRRLPMEQRGYGPRAELFDPDICEGTVTSAAISKDGCHIALGFGNGGIEVVDIDQQHSITRFQCDSCSPPVWIEFISGGPRIATEDNEGNVFIFDHGSQPLKLGTLPSGHYPPVTVAADNGSFIVRLPRHLDLNWYESVSILYASGEPSVHLLSSPGTIIPAHHPHCLFLELSPGAGYVVACDQNQAFIWSTTSRQFIISRHLLDFGAFVTGVTPYRPYITSGAIEDSEDDVPHRRGSGVKYRSDKSWLKSLSHRSLRLSQRPRLLPATEPSGYDQLEVDQELVSPPKLKLLLDNTLKLILPIQYHPIVLSMGCHDGLEEWYGDRVIGYEEFIYFPRASKDGMRFLVQGRMRAPIVIDISQIA